MKKNTFIALILLGFGFSSKAQQQKTGVVSETMTRQETPKKSSSTVKFSDKEIKDAERFKMEVTDEVLQKAIQIDHEIEQQRQKQLSTQKLTAADKERVNREFDVMREKMLKGTLGDNNFEMYMKKYHNK